MKKQNQLSKAEMRNVTGGGGFSTQSCTLECEGVFSFQVSNCEVIEIEVPECMNQTFCRCGSVEH